MNCIRGRTHCVKPHGRSSITRHPSSMHSESVGGADREMASELGSVFLASCCGAMHGGCACVCLADSLRPDARALLGCPLVMSVCSASAGGGAQGGLLEIFPAGAQRQPSSQPGGKRLGTSADLKEARISLQAQRRARTPRQRRGQPMRAIVSSPLLALTREGT